MLMTIGISTKDNQSKGTMISSLLKFVDSKELHPQDIELSWDEKDVKQNSDYREYLDLIQNE